MMCARFVSEQMKRLSAGDDEAEAARKAQWELRNQGIDIRIRPVSACACVSLVYISLILFACVRCSLIFV